MLDLHVNEMDLGPSCEARALRLGWKLLSPNAADTLCGGSPPHSPLRPPCHWGAPPGGLA